VFVSIHQGFVFPFREKQNVKLKSSGDAQLLIATQVSNGERFVKTPAMFLVKGVLQ